MAKRRKRTNSMVPAKGVLRDMADKLWSIAIRSDWNWRCAVCGRTPCEAHHMIPREKFRTRYDLRNGIALCATHHRFCPNTSPHNSGFGFSLWLKENHPEREAWVEMKLSCKRELDFDGTKNEAYYISVIESLREYVEPDEFERVCGVKFSRYLEANR